MQEGSPEVHDLIGSLLAVYMLRKTGEMLAGAADLLVGKWYNNFFDVTDDIREIIKRMKKFRIKFYSFLTRKRT